MDFEMLWWKSSTASTFESRWLLIYRDIDEFYSWPPLNSQLDCDVRRQRANRLDCEWLSFFLCVIYSTMKCSFIMCRMLFIMLYSCLVHCLNGLVRFVNGIFFFARNLIKSFMNNRNTIRPSRDSLQLHVSKWMYGPKRTIYKYINLIHCIQW